MFKAYLDASGSARDPSIETLAVSGFVAHEDQWAAFDEGWPSLLRKYEIAEFHMSQFAQCSGEFKKWRGADKEPIRRQFIQDIAKFINEHTQEPLGAMIDLHAYEWFNERFFIEEALGTPYGMAAQSAYAAVWKWKQRSRITEPVLVIFEKGDNEQSDFRKFLKNRIKWDEPGDQPAEPIFCKKRWVDANGLTRYCLPFQASDFLAYENAKMLVDALRDGKYNGRKSAFALAEQKMFTTINRHVLWNFVKNQLIPQRAGREADYRVPEGPVCYVGLDGALTRTTGRFNN